MTGIIVNHNRKQMIKNIFVIIIVTLVYLTNFGGAISAKAENEGQSAKIEEILNKSKNQNEKQIEELTEQELIDIAVYLSNIDEQTKEESELLKEIIQQQAVNKHNESIELYKLVKTATYLVMALVGMAFVMLILTVKR